MMSTAQTIASQEETIQDITRRLVAFYQPVRIYLFGSARRAAIVDQTVISTSALSYPMKHPQRGSALEHLTARWPL